MTLPGVTSRPFRIDAGEFAFLGVRRLAAALVLGEVCLVCRQ
jgi:hypothetical protein